MTNRERFIRCALNQPVDRLPFCFYFGPWGETLEEWRKQGVEHPETAWQDPAFGFDPPILNASEHVNLLYLPGFEYKVLEERGDHVVYQDSFGILSESIKGKSGIPKILRNPIACREDWERIRDQRLNPDDPARFSPTFEAFVEKANSSDQPVQIGAYPYGLFGTLRDMIGVETLCYWFYEEPELVKEIMDYLTSLWISLYEKVARRVKIDLIHIWEDMSGKSGSLISPAMVREFMLPNYRRIADFAKAHDIPVITVDTDGICDELIPLFLEGGVNLMMPFEVAAGNDIVDLRRRFPQMAMMGGIDKLEVARGKEGIEGQLDRIRPLLSQSGYFPALDHLIHPDISYEDYCYFVRRLREEIFACRKEVP